VGQPNEPHTPAYQRHERALGRSRKQARFEGIMTVLLSAIVLFFSILLLIGWLIARTAPWYAYVALLVIAIAGIAFLLPAGLHAYRRGGLCDFAAYCGKIERNMLHKESGTICFIKGVGVEMGTLSPSELAHIIIW
jgi:hypothetical protein